MAVALPDDPALHGTALYLQALAADPEAPSGLMSSAGLSLTLFAGR
jgi:hypothetical protein